MTQPEALRLADHLEREYYVPAAYELRRLHENNEKKSEAIQRLWKERDELRVQRDELLEALTWIGNRCPVHLVDEPLHNIQSDTNESLRIGPNGEAYTRGEDGWMYQVGTVEDIANAIRGKI